MMRHQDKNDKSITGNSTNAHMKLKMVIRPDERVSWTWRQELKEEAKHDEVIEVTSNRQMCGVRLKPSDNLPKKRTWTKLPHGRHDDHDSRLPKYLPSFANANHYERECEHAMPMRNATIHQLPPQAGFISLPTPKSPDLSSPDNALLLGGVGSVNKPTDRPQKKTTPSPPTHETCNLTPERS